MGATLFFCATFGGLYCGFAASAVGLAMASDTIATNGPPLGLRNKKEVR